MKRKIKPLAIIMIVIIPVCIAGFFIFNYFIQQNKLQAYNSETRSLVSSLKLTKLVVKYPYSEFFDQAATAGVVTVENAEYFLNISKTSLSYDEINTVIPLLIELDYTSNQTKQLLDFGLDYQQVGYILEKPKIVNVDIFLAVFQQNSNLEQSVCAGGFNKKEADKIADKQLAFCDFKTLIDTGYSLEDAFTISSILSLDDFSVISKINYFPKLVELIENSDFNFSNLARYLWQIDQQPQVTTNEIISYINNNEDVVSAENIDWSSYYTNITKVNDPDSFLVVVNKQYQLAKNYAPKDLKQLPSGYYVHNHPMRKQAADSFVKLAKAASQEGYTIKAASNYRSYELQEYLYQSYVSDYGKKVADSISCRPGHSEHQTGLVADFAGNNNDLTRFGQDASYKWTVSNAHKYGFIQRYPKGKEYITGIDFEAWHFRYVGVEAATIIHKYQWTLEEYIYLFGTK